MIERHYADPTFVKTQSVSQISKSGGRWKFVGADVSPNPMTKSSPVMV